MNSQHKESNSLNLLALRIKKLRVNKGLKQYDLGVDERTIRRIEHENFNPSFLTLMSISEALEISISELLDFSEEKEETKK